MKVLFLVYHGFNDASGITKKIQAQVEGLRQCGHEVHVCTYDWDKRGHRCRFVDGNILEDYGTGILAAIRKRTSYDEIYKYCLSQGIEAVYVRSFHNANPWTIHLFRKLRLAGIKSVMEIPTYPYDSEYSQFGWFERWSLKIDQVYRRKLAREMNAIVTFSDVEDIFGQRTIRISNGVDFDAIPVRVPSVHDNQEIHLLGVAEVHLWHGYDRLIEGLANYHKERNEQASTPSDLSKENPNDTKEEMPQVYFHIVGGVSEKDRKDWDLLIRKKGIEQYVIFHGQQFGEELTRSFNRADFGIGSLARHRSGIQNIKTLKNREYAARGLAFVYSETDEDFEHMPYVMKVPADDSPINIHHIFHFLRTHTFVPQEIRATITHLSWKEQMKKVMESMN